MSNAKQIIITTTNTIQGREINNYLAIVYGECVLGTGHFSENEAKISDFFGAESNDFGRKLKKAKQLALEYMKNEAVKYEADAIVGANVEITTVGKNMFVASATGTAVTLKRIIKETVALSQKEQSKEIWVTNYCAVIPFRFENAEIINDSNNTYVRIYGMNYGVERIQAVKADIEFITKFDDCIEEKNLTFDVINDQKGNFVTSEFEVNVQKKEFDNIKAIKVYIKCYVVDDKSINIEHYTYEDVIIEDFEKKKEKYGKDFFADPEEFGDSWKCVCGHTNKKGEVCSICGKSYNKIISGIEQYMHLYDLAKDKSNAIEIYELYKNYLSKNPSDLMEIHLEKLKSIAANERLYGNRKKNAIKYIEENICEK